ncbi:hypothetical protein [Arthrobacter sp. B3I4]|uniref:sunset domain-containing protein n=1 Tax=Arthrobacter sp. B3I4 TaxID=3042267 RepID=UPI00277D2173|nr:hypothetical protein [Arthrobacter sp. B3I4]MDQ0755960.1 hypothetical protein [Arthrobacter sp. B3I4]
MDWIIWLIVIVVIVGVVWWLLNRNNARSGAGASTSTVAGTAPAPEAPVSRETPEPRTTGGVQSADAVSDKAVSEGAVPDEVGSADAAGARGDGETGGTVQPAGSGSPGATPAAAGAVEGAEWETQWSETPPAEPHPASQHDVPSGAHAVQPSTAERPAAEHAPAHHSPVHHSEYTEPHAPTLPGAESAAAELAEADLPQDGTSVASAEGSASHVPAPAGHLALAQPYGEGSAAPAPDGSGPEDFTVKGSASTMVYYDETSPLYGETRAEVWFLSAAHAEAAGFRPPRRSRL